MRTLAFDMLVFRSWHDLTVPVWLQNSANGIALKTKDDMLRLDAMVMTVQLGIRKLLVSPVFTIQILTPHQQTPLLRD